MFKTAEEKALKKALDHQGKVDRNGQAIQALEAEIQRQQQVITEAKNFSNPLPELNTRREDLLANLVTGEATEDELSALDADIDKAAAEVESKTAKADIASGKAGQVINGLNRKLAKLKSEQSVLNSDTADVLVEYLNMLEESAGKQYIEHAQQLIEDYKVLEGLGALVKKIQQQAGQRERRSLLGFRAELTIPLFRLKAFENKGMKTLDVLFTSEHSQTRVKLKNEGEETQRKQLAELGLAIP